MAAAAIPVRMAMLVPLLAMIALSQASANEPALVETALGSDDQCANGDAACALNALQRRGAALAPAAEERSLLSEGIEEGEGGKVEKSSRRRRAPKVPDLSPGGEKKFKKQVRKIAGGIRKLEQDLVNMEENVNMTYRMVSDPSSFKGKGGGSRGGGGSSRDTAPGGDDEFEDDGEDGDEEPPTWLEADSEISSASSRRRHPKPPPRTTAVQHMVDKCQAVMNKFWKRTTRLDRLCEWIKMKIQNPGAPDWEEPDDLDDDDDDDDDEKKKKNKKEGEEEESLVEMEEGSRRRRDRLSIKEENPEDANMQKIVDELDREVTSAKKELERIGKNANGARKMAMEALPDA